QTCALPIYIRMRHQLPVLGKRVIDSAELEWRQSFSLSQAILLPNPLHQLLVFVAVFVSSIHFLIMLSNLLHATLNANFNRQITGPNLLFPQPLHHTPDKASITHPPQVFRRQIRLCHDSETLGEEGQDTTLALRDADEVHRLFYGFDDAQCSKRG